MSKKSVAIKVIVHLVAVSTILYFYNDYILGLLSERPDFQISAEPSLIRIGYVGSSNTTTIMIKSINGLDSNVTFDAKPVLGFIGIRWLINPSEVHLQAYGEVTSVLQIDVMTVIPPGEYYIYVSGAVGNLTHTVRITVEVKY